MGVTTENSLLPIIVADLADARARDFLEGVALASGTVLVPLMAAPADKGDHILEVHVPNENDPTLFLARPAGAPQREGFPLKLRPFGTRQSARPPAVEDPHEKTPSVVARSWNDVELSERHTQDLDPNAEPKEKSGFADLVGRALAGGKLQIEERLGSGGVGAVYRATHRDLRKEVAVKVLRDSAQRDLEFCQRFHAEALAASRLDHPNLIRVIDFGQEPDGLLYLSMDFLDGMSLQDLLDRQKKLPVFRALEIMLQVSAGLWHAHARGIVHRDVKPANIMLVAGHDDDGQPIELVKVCDFGIALQPSSNDDDRGVAGTPEYMSPEACQGAALDGRADIYACGVMLYELVTGRLPFTANSSVEFARQHILAVPPPPSQFFPDIDPRLEALILRSLAKAPHERFPSAREFRNALKEVSAPPAPKEAPPAARSPAPSAVAQRTPAAPIAPVIAEAPKPSGRADWLEDTKESYDSFFTSIASTVEAGGYHEADALANEIAASPVDRMNEIAILRASPAFAVETDKLEVAVRSLARRGEAVALGHVVRVMAAIYAEEAKRVGAEVIAPGSPGARALAIVHIIADPVTLQPFAEKLLSDRAEPTEAAYKLLAWAQVAGAHALYAARLKQPGPVARERFVGAMRALGVQAAPVLRGALDQLLPPNESAVSDVALAEDLLIAAQDVKDEAIGGVIVRYARLADPPSIARAAVTALVSSWGSRALPVLLASLQSAEEPLKIAALRGLRILGGVDEFVVRKVEGILDGSVTASDDLRVAAVESVSGASPSARGTATRLVLSILARGDGMMSMVRGRTNPAVVIAFARAALSLAPTDALAAIHARAEKSAEPLKAQLLSLTATRPRATTSS